MNDKLFGHSANKRAVFHEQLGFCCILGHDDGHFMFVPMIVRFGLMPLGACSRSVGMAMIARAVHVGLTVCLVKTRMRVRMGMRRIVPRMFVPMVAGTTAEKSETPHKCSGSLEMNWFR
jgi:hypothetical protein